MKKIISFILIAVLCLGVLTSCAQIGGVVDSIKDKLGLGENQPAGPSVEAAADFLNDIYKDKKETTMADFDVIGRVSLDGVIFPVTWSSNNDKVVIRESTKVGYYTVDLPDVNSEEFGYTLTATVSDANGNTAQKSYSFKVPVIDNSGITSTPVEGTAYKLFLLQGSENRRYYALNSSQNNENKFINTTLNPKDGAEFFVEKVDGGYKIYTDVSGVKTYIYAKVTRTEDASTGNIKYSKFIGFNAEEGSVFTYSESKGGVWTVKVDGLVYGVGTYGSYTTISISDESYFTPEKVGDSQFVLQFMTAEHANTLEEDKLPDSPSDAEGILNQLYALADGESATGEFTITGKIIELDSYNNPTIVVEGFENMPVYCYRLSVEQKVGDTITVTATQMKNYGGTYEFMNCTLVEGGNSGDQGGNGGNTETPSDLGIVNNPEVGVAYKFGLFHGNENATVFFNGQNYNSYAWYLAYDATGVDVYLEAVEGVENAYRLFFYNGEAKTYIVAFPRDGDTTKGTLKLDTATPAEYFTFSAEYSTLIYTSVTGEQFYLGSSGTYKSISCSAISYITNADSYVAHLYAEGATGDEPVIPHEHNFVNGECACGEKDPNYVPPEIPEDGVYTIPEVLQAAEGTAVIVKGTVVEIYQAWNPQYNNVSFYIADEAGNRLLVFRTGTNANIGDQVTVTGTATLYNNVVQIAQGGTTVIDVAHTCSTLTEADCLNAPACTVCGKTSGEALGHNYVNGSCERCGEVAPSGEVITASKTIAELITALGWTSSTTKQSFTLDDVVSVKINGGSNTGKAYNGDHIRIYATDTPAGTITISVAEGYELVSIKISTQTGTYAFLCVDGSDADISNVSTKVSGSSVLLNSVKNGSDGKQVRVTAIEVVYMATQGGSDTPVEPPHEHNFVDGKCECGETDPEYVAPETPAFGVVTPVAGTAYKFGMVQSNAGKTVYLAGGMSGYYMATTEDVNAAIDVYLEETDSGYYLYTLNADGSKLYINMVVSGTHVNGAYEAAASTVYTIDADRKSIVATVNDELYHFGTRNDNTYLTVGPCKVSYNGFDCQFYGATGSDTPVEPPHEHNFVEGKCECGEEDPNYVPETPVEPENPEVTEGKSADFDTIVLPSNKQTGDSSYTNTYTTEDGWVTTNSAIQCGGTTDMNPQFVVIGSDTNSKAVCMNGKVGAAGTITSPTLNGGISKLTIKYTKMFTDTKLSATVTITDVTTGATYTEQISVELPKDEKYQVYTFEWTLDAPISGDFKIEIVNDCPSQATGNKDRMTVLDIIWE